MKRKQCKCGNYYYLTKNNYTECCVCRSGHDYRSYKNRKQCKCGNYYNITKNNYIECSICRPCKSGYPRNRNRKQCKCGNYYNITKNNYIECSICRLKKDPYYYKKRQKKYNCFICNKKKYKKRPICKECKEKIKPNLFCYTCKIIYSIDNLPDFYKNSKAPWKSRCYECYKNNITKINNKKVTYEKLKKLEWCEIIRKDPKNKKLGQVKCTYNKCQRWFSPTNWEFKNREYAVKKGIGENSFYCSNKCKQKCDKYMQHYSVLMKKDAGIIDKKELNREVQPELRLMCIERDNYECKKCGKKEDLQCHHIEGIRWDPLESADIDKCITVCYPCHVLIHQIPGCTYHDMKCDIENRQIFNIGKEHKEIFEYFFE